MVKIRLTALPDELWQEVERLKENHNILSISKPEHNRSSKYLRVYADIDVKDKEPISYQP